ncbi:MAG: hypothetical protein OXU35_01510 [Acidobacteriota bacterium]|nr:hypothetical protein [Acidobacteriota bacterium]
MSSGQIRWNQLTKWMDELLPGWEMKRKEHGIHIYCPALKPRAFVALPKGAHGRTNPEIALFHVKKLFRFFGKLPEAKARIPQL